jgi:hypothetical protein
MDRTFRVLMSFAACLFFLALMTLSIRLGITEAPLTGGTAGDESRREGSIRMLGESGIGLALSGCYCLRDDGGADIFLSGCCGSVRSLFTLDRRIRLMVELPGGSNREIPVRAIYAQHAPLFDLGRDDIPATMVWQES